MVTFYRVTNVRQLVRVVPFLSLLQRNEKHVINFDRHAMMQQTQTVPHVQIDTFLIRVAALISAPMVPTEIQIHGNECLVTFHELNVLENQEKNERHEASH